MPLATLITSASRLILALLEHEIVSRGGNWAFCDTDSMAVATDYTELETVNARRAVNQRSDSLSTIDVDQIEFAALSPYEFGGSILKIEDENYAIGSETQRIPLYALVISAKRYVLTNINPDGSFHIRRMSEHGLGTYQNPEANAGPQDLDR